MKKISLLIVLGYAFLGTAAIAQETENVQYHRDVSKKLIIRYSHFEMNFRIFIQAIEDSLILRRDALDFFSKLHNKLTSDQHLTAAEQQAIVRHIKLYRADRDRFNQLMDTYSTYSKPALKITFSSGQPSKDPTELNSKNSQPGTELVINPEDDLARLMVLESKMWLASKMMLLDNYAVVLVRYLKNADLRRQFDIKSIDPESKQFLEEMLAEIQSGERYSQTLHVLKLVNQYRAFEQKNPDSALAKDKDNRYLNSLLDGSYAYHRIPELTFFDNIEIGTAVKRNEFADDVNQLTDFATDKLLGRMFDNVIGLYKFRDGKLNVMPESEQNTIVQELDLLDILFTKSPFRLTDSFIPGH